MNQLQQLIKKIMLQIMILKIKIQILLLKEKLTIPNLPSPRYVVIHHGAGNLDFNGVNEYHKQKWGFRSSLGYYIGYHKFIEFDGSLHIGRRDNEEGAHTVEPGNPGYWNKNSVGIGLQGNFETQKPTMAQISTLKKELDAYKSKGCEIKMHYEISSTLCPGKNLKKWVIDYRNS